MSINKVILVGNVGKDPEVRHMDSGTVKASFTLATSETYKNKSGELTKQTEWHNIVAWRQLAEVAEKFIKKGMQLYVEGKITTRSWDDKDGNKRYITEIVADTLQMLGKKEGQSENLQNLPSQPKTNDVPASNDEELLAPDNDLPF